MDEKEFYLDAIRDVVPAHKEEQIQDVFYSYILGKTVKNTQLR